MIAEEIGERRWGRGESMEEEEIGRERESMEEEEVGRGDRGEEMGRGESMEEEEVGRGDRKREREYGRRGGGERR